MNTNNIEYEHFFVGDKFYYSMSEYVDDLYTSDRDDNKIVDDDFVDEITFSDLEPMFQLSPERLSEILFDIYEDRYPEYLDEKTIENILERNIDFESINRELPKLYFANSNKVQVTGKEINEYYEKN